MKKLLFVCAFLISSCQAGTSKSDAAPYVSPDMKITDYVKNNEWDIVLKMRDKSQQTTCYIYSGYNKGGISCVKDAAQ